MRGVAWLGVCLVLLAPLAASASESFRPGLGEAARVVARILKDRGADSIGLGEFSGPPSYGSAAGGGLRRVLTEELARQHVAVKKVGAALGLKGQYRPKVQGNAAHLEVELAVIDKAGNSLEDLSAEIELEARTVSVSKGIFRLLMFGDNDPSGTTALCEALGGNVNLVPKGKPAPSGQMVIDTIENPRSVLKNGWASASEDCPFYLGVLVNGRMLPLRMEDGQPWVDLRKGDVFQVQVFNGASYPVGASVLLDGVSTFAFSEFRMNAAGEPIQVENTDIGIPRFSRYIVGANQKHIVRGWHKSMQEITDFKMVDFVDSAFARVGGTSGLGTISVTARATWLEGASPPEDEIEPAETLTLGSRLTATSDGNPFAAGEGERRRGESRADTAKRIYGKARAVITIRYAKPQE